MQQQLLSHLLVHCIVDKQSAKTATMMMMMKCFYILQLKNTHTTTNLIAVRVNVITSNDAITKKAMMA